ncbi:MULTISPECIES: hypothetical protein [Aeromonas]|nr:MULTISPECIES: hypothetical protein [Aeromonas]MCE9925668.1 hypothetical protein [Aeromonas media]MCX4048336.1 hypothetical protein [Aeromonas caviae]MCX4107622.1 hypothetical protein [Aeromonas caviae]MDX7763981.1 hypothetical protein [Aeromonas caviae]MDX7947957.1 hypothetical protein [Aeromonas caviae]
MSRMNTAQDFNRLYFDVSENISQALADITELKIEHKDGQQQLSEMTRRLRDIQGCFNEELDYLKENAEWDKFTIAFFGETNAGKSTIIESLRILFKEESRQQLLLQNQQDLAKFERSLTELAEQLRTDLERVYAEHATQVAAIRQCAGQLAKTLETEGCARLQIARDEASARTMRKLIAAAIAGVVVGTGAMALVNMLVGG